MGTSGVIVASIFRDSSDYLNRYFEQVDALEEHLPVQLVVAEGDSTDDTWRMLEASLEDDDVLIKKEHGGPKFGSVDHQDRWWRIALVCNAVMEQIPDDGRPVIYVESDLMWPVETMLTLLDDLERVSAVAPLSMKDGRFYDIWGHRGLDGHRFSPHPPYHPDLEGAEGLVPIGSAGSCVVMRGDVAQKVRFGENDCIVGLGRDLQQNGGLYLDPRVAVHHP